MSKKEFVVSSLIISLLLTAMFIDLVSVELGHRVWTS